MTERQSIITDLLANLDVALLEQIDGGRFRIVGRPPAWFADIWPEAGLLLEGFRPQERSPFLENFLVDAARAWEGAVEAPVRSGLWIEVDARGREWYLEATALFAERRRFIAIKEERVPFLQQAQLLQRARERTLSYERLAKEIERKDVLLHCIIHDLRSPLVSLHTCLTFLKEEPDQPESRDLIDVGLAQIKRQDALIRTILDVFKADLDVAHASASGEIPAVNLEHTAREVIEGLKPVLDVQGVGVSLTVDGGAEAHLVEADALRLERVLTNLLDNAFRHSPPGSSITVHILRENDTIVTKVEDEGPGVPPESVERLFDRFAQTGDRPGGAGLGLHFCRIAVEGWGGEIGYDRRSPSGSSFWFRLPCASSPTAAEDSSGVS